MSEEMVVAVVVTNLLLGAMTFGMVIACVVGGCRAAWRSRAAQRVSHPATA